MKKSLMALALFGAFAGVAHAQTAVQIYGTLDAGFIKRTGSTLNIGKRASNTLGFKGTEELGNGLKALFQLEMRYDPDTGLTESGTATGGRPLFQGQSRVGLQGDFGMVRIGRGLTPFQEAIGAFEPFHGLPTPAGFFTDLSVAGYTSQPLDPSPYSNNRWSNAFFYNSPANLMGGLQVNAAIATKEGGGGRLIGRGTDAAPQYAANAEGSTTPFSVTAVYNNGPAAVLLAYERNLVESKVWSLAGSITPIPDLKLMASYTRQDRGHTMIANPKTKAWVLGAAYNLGPGKLLAGYGQKRPDNFTRTKQFSLGYEYSLSKRTYLYVDASRKKGATTTYVGNVNANPQNVTHYDLGINHSF